MDDQRFDRLTRLAATASRRRVLEAIAGAAGGGLLSLAGIATGQAAPCRRGQKNCPGCCRGGICLSGTDQDACGRGGDACADCGACQICRPGRGCVPDPRQNGQLCDDGDGCTTADTCRNGVCRGVPVTCPDPFETCRVCNPETGACDKPVADGTPCADGDPCTEFESCQAGVCVAGRRRPCGECGVCDSSTGECVPDLTRNGQPCNDGRTCTVDDTCQDGVCAGRDACGVCATCDPGDQRCIPLPAGTPCDEGEVCMRGACDGSGVCRQEPLPSGTPCDDGNLCTQTDTCDGEGACVGHNPVVCTALDQCHVAGTCDPATGQCSNPNAPNGTQCDDGEPCTVDDFCFNGICAAGDPFPCGDCQICRSGLGCLPDPDQNDRPCDDGDACTVNDQCEDGTCVGTPLDCGPCATCDSELGCVALPAGTPCTDDGNSCTSDVCDGAGTCQHDALPNGTACDDGDPCTIDDFCFEGRCAAGEFFNCGRCQVCDPATGDCVADPSQNGQTCDDGDLCTGPDTCQNGVCVGDATPCPLCHECNPNTGACDPVANGSPCDDGNPCTDDDQCLGGVCTGTPIGGCRRCESDGECADGNPCTEDRCDPATGTCVNLPLENCCTSGEQCDDGDPCTEDFCTFEFGAPPGTPGQCTHFLIAGCRPCQTDAECADQVCVANLCRPATCGDGAINGDESDVDCGGSCAPCEDGAKCRTNADCLLHICFDGFCGFEVNGTLPPTCSDGILNGDESDLDCGGRFCAACPDDSVCRTGADCVSQVCANDVCQAPSCNDGILNGTETDLDCGGDCPPCPAGSNCLDDIDCQTGLCSGGVCIPAGNCEETGCPECQMCDPTSGCVPDPSQQFCAGFTGLCTGGTCVVCDATTCPNGCCSGGECFTDEAICCAPGGNPRSCGPGQTCNRTSGACEPPCDPETNTCPTCEDCCCFDDICKAAQFCD